MTATFAGFMSEANRINKERFMAAQAHARECNHKPPCLAPMLCVPLVEVCMKQYFDAGMTPEQALDAMDSEESSVNAVMCRAEMY